MLLLCDSLCNDVIHNIFNFTTQCLPIKFKQIRLRIIEVASSCGFRFASLMSKTGQF
jgi:hypothetical protein